ncbi:hypothetical protein Tco_0809126 [Tanacetum coccineum]
MMYPSIRLKGLPSELERDILSMTPRKLQIVSSDLKSSLRWLPIWESATRSPKPFAVLSMAWHFKHHPHTLRSPSKHGRAKYCTISFVDVVDEIMTLVLSEALKTGGGIGVAVKVGSPTFSVCGGWLFVSSRGDGKLGSFLGSNDVVVLVLAESDMGVV